MKTKTILNQNFLKPLLSFTEISRHRFYLGIILNIVFSFLFFNFLIIVIELLNITIKATYLSVKHIYNYSSYKYYLFFVAFYAVSFASLMMLEFWHNTPQSTNFSKKKRRSILYERKAFIPFLGLFVFRFVLFHIYIQFEDFLILCLSKPFIDYKYLIHLFAILVFLDLWIGIRRVYKVKYAYMLLSLLVMVVLSIVIIFLRPYNDNQFLTDFDKKINSTNFKVPDISTSYSINRACSDKIFVSKNFDIFYNNQSVNLNRLQSYLYYSKIENQQNRYRNPCLYIDESLSMKKFSLIKQKFLNADILKVQIVVNTHFNNCENKIKKIPFHFNQLSMFYTFKNNSLSLFKRDSLMPLFPTNLLKENSEKKHITIKILKDGILANDTLIDLKKNRRFNFIKK